MTSLLCQKCNFWLKAFFTPQKEHWKKKASEPEAWNSPRSFCWIHVASDLRLLTLKPNLFQQWLLRLNLQFLEHSLSGGLWNETTWTYVPLPSLCLLHPMLSGSLNRTQFQPKDLVFSQCVLTECCWHLSSLSKKLNSEKFLHGLQSFLKLFPSSSSSLFSSHYKWIALKILCFSKKSLLGALMDGKTKSI